MSKPKPDQLEIGAAAASVRALVDDKIVNLSRRCAYRFSRPQIQKARVQMEARVFSNDWADAPPATLVALYEWLHREVYGVDAAELDGRAWAFALSAAKRMIEREFGGDIAEAVDFVKWSWKREGQREKFRRESNRDGLRIGWRLLFQSGYLITDYRIAKARSR